MDIKKHIKKGNKKVGKDTLIFNMGTAHDCPSRKLGLCQLKNVNHCYAYLDECRFPAVGPYRERQACIWKNSDAKTLAEAFRSASNKDTKYVRYNESGDFYSQDCVQKVFDIAKLLPDLTFYLYTARKDLKFAGRPKNVVVQGSGWKRGNLNRFNAVLEYTGKNPQCPGDCSACVLCKVQDGKTIENLMHGSIFNLKKKA